LTEVALPHPAVPEGVFHRPVDRFRSGPQEAATGAEKTFCQLQYLSTLLFGRYGSFNPWHLFSSPSLIWER
jgi:hypothetical protein